MNIASTAIGSSKTGFRLPHSLLITRFLRPAIPRFEGDISAWTSALGETPESVIDRFKRANFLVPFAPSTPEMLTEGIGGIYGVAQLKAMLKSRGLKVSGKKSELISRLVGADCAGLTRDVAALGLFHCSEAGRHLAAEFEKRKDAAYISALSALTKRDYRCVIRAYDEIEKELGFPRPEYSGTLKPEFIELLMTLAPRILEGCSGEVMARLRTAMALQYVAGRHAPPHMLRDVVTGIQLDAETAARMIYFFARHTEDIQQWKQLGITHVTHLATSDSCDFCARQNGRKWNLGDAPELPAAECTDSYGCRCLYQPVLNF